MRVNELDKLRAKLDDAKIPLHLRLSSRTGIKITASFLLKMMQLIKGMM